MTMQGIWWFKTEAEFLEDPETKAKGVFDRLEECTVNVSALNPTSTTWRGFV
eukprot:COSAG05_NODE_6677_length_922_cov_0.869988_1_plen_52_part_00